MGQRFATARVPQVATVVDKPLRVDVRCDEICPAVLARVAQARVEGRLGGVHVDCRGRYDEDGMESLEKAAGVHKLVLHCR